MGHVSILLDKMRLDKMGLDEMGINQENECCEKALTKQKPTAKPLWLRSG